MDERAQSSKRVYGENTGLSEQKKTRCRSVWIGWILVKFTWESTE
jgi:hypothetical protein